MDTRKLKVVQFVKSGAFGHVYLVSILNEQDQHVEYKILKQCMYWGDCLLPYDILREINVANILSIQPQVGQNRLLPVEEIWLSKTHAFYLMTPLLGTMNHLLDAITELKEEATAEEEEAEEDNQYNDMEGEDLYDQDDDNNEKEEEKLVVEKDTNSYDSKGRLLNQYGYVADLLMFEVDDAITFQFTTSSSTNTIGNEPWKPKMLQDWTITKKEKNDQDDHEHEFYDKQIIDVLKEYLLKEKFFTKSGYNHFLIHMIQDLLTCLAQCHENGICHDDICRDNIGIRMNNETKKLELMLIDWSQSTILTHPYSPNDFVCRRNHAPYEVYFYEHIFAAPKDLWNIGLLIGDLICCPKDFYVENPFDIEEPTPSCESSSSSESEFSGSESESESSEEGSDQDQETKEEKEIEQSPVVQEFASSNADLLNSLSNNDVEILKDKIKSLDSFDPSNPIVNYIMQVLNKPSEETTNQEIELENTPETNILVVPLKQTVSWDNITKFESELFRDFLLHRGLMQWIDKDGNNHEACTEKQLKKIEKQAPELSQEILDNPYVMCNNGFFLKEIDLFNLESFVKHIKKRRDYLPEHFPNYILKIWLKMLLRSSIDRPSAKNLLDELRMELQKKHKIEESKEVPLLASSNNYASFASPTRPVLMDSEYHIPNKNALSQLVIDSGGKIMRFSSRFDSLLDSIQNNHEYRSIIFEGSKLLLQFTTKEDFLWDKRHMLSSLQIFHTVLLKDPIRFQASIPLFLACNLLAENCLYIFNDYQVGYGNRDELMDLQREIICYGLEGNIDRFDTSLWQILQTALYSWYENYHVNDFPTQYTNPSIIEYVQTENEFLTCYTLLEDIVFWIFYLYQQKMLPPEKHYANLFDLFQDAYQVLNVFIVEQEDVSKEQKDQNQNSSLWRSYIDLIECVEDSSTYWCGRWIDILLGK